MSASLGACVRARRLPRPARQPPSGARTLSPIETTCGRAPWRCPDGARPRCKQSCGSASGICVGGRLESLMHELGFYRCLTVYWGTSTHRAVPWVRERHPETCARGCHSDATRSASESGPRHACGACAARRGRLPRSACQVHVHRDRRWRQAARLPPGACPCCTFLKGRLHGAEALWCGVAARRRAPSVAARPCRMAYHAAMGCIIGAHAGILGPLPLCWRSEGEKYRIHVPHASGRWSVSRSLVIFILGVYCEILC